MRTEKEIKKEIERRNGLNYKPSNYAAYKTNRNVVYALEWVLEMRNFLIKAEKEKNEGGKKSAKPFKI